MAIAIWQKKAKNVTFLTKLQFFFRVWQIVTQDKCFGPPKRNLQKWTWNTEILLINPKQLRFWRCTENKICYIYNLNIINNKKIGCYFLKKKHSFCQITFIAIASGACNLVASERKWQAVSEMV